MNDPERDHLLLRVAELDRARRRWKVLALAGTPALLLFLLALGNAVSSVVALRAVVLRERQAHEDARRAAENALRQAEDPLGEPSY